ncbi:hypothetical protein LIER_04720 [Lithospermum erythrorhizon]|uniref:DUF4283 domain-containing protein n=1 Tax=Lithospermum erythrorhizon TaxID=34254 RepID=A0AAV3P1V6_LITER
MGSENALKNSRNFVSLVSNVSPRIETLDSQKSKIDGQTSDGEVHGGDVVVSGDGNDGVPVAQAGGRVRKVHDFEKQGRIMMKFTQPDVVEGILVVKIKSVVVRPVVNRWRTAVVGYSFGLNPSHAAMSNFVKMQWKDCGQLEIFKLDSGLFVFRFESEELREKIIIRGPWMYSRRPLIL